jgi:hypothetical protein
MPKHISQHLNYSPALGALRASGPTTWLRISVRLKSTHLLGGLQRLLWAGDVYAQTCESRPWNPAGGSVAMHRLDKMQLLSRFSGRGGGQAAQCCECGRGGTYKTWGDAQALLSQ